MKQAAAAVTMAAALFGFAGRASAAPATAPPPLTIQATYDQAQAAFDRGDWTTAASGFSTVLAKAGPLGRPEGIIRSRLAEALLNQGRVAEAEAEVNQALQILRAGVSGPDADIAEADLTLGDVLRAELSYEAALDAYRQADALAAGPNAGDISTSARLGLVRVAMVTHPDVAAATLDAIIGAQADFAKHPADWQAQILSLRARAELNQNNARKALPFIERALKLDGPIGSSVRLHQVAIRGDAALVYAMLGDGDHTREYLTYAGAGHLPDDEDWSRGADIDVPICGPDIAAEDSAVVEFAIGDDGRTAGVEPIYSSHPGDAGVEFARAVRSWRWKVEDAAKLNGFWRASIRVQLRCATRPPPLSLGEPFGQATKAWLAGLGIRENLTDVGPTTTDASPPATGAPSGAAAIPAQFRRLWAAKDSRRRAAAAEQLDALLVAAGAPIEARAYAASLGALGDSGMASSWANYRAKALQAVLPIFDKAAGGERSAAWLRVELAVSLETAGNYAAARQPLLSVVSLPTTALGANDPIRSVAILHLSLLDRKAGDVSGAAARLTSAGLTAQKCDLLDVRPVPTNEAVSGADFPAEADRWGFAGWVRVGFDISADGTVKTPRALISYPPSVFGDATEKIVSRFRYLPPTLGDTALGCTGQTLNVRFAPASR